MFKWCLLSFVLMSVAPGYGQHKDDELRFLASGVKYYRSSSLSGQVCLFSSKSQRPELMSLFGIDRDAVQTSLRHRMPNNTRARTIWLADDTSTIIDVTLLGNLAGDGQPGNHQVRSVDLIAPSGNSRLLTIRRRRFNRSQRLEERFDQIGYTHFPLAALTDGIMTGNMSLDPRYLLYYVSDKPLDHFLDKTIPCQVQQLGRQSISGFSCVKIRITEDHKTSRVIHECWIDDKNGFIVRRARTVGGQKGITTVVADQMATGLLKIGDRWFPKFWKYTLRVPLLDQARVGNVPDELKVVRFQPLTTEERAQYTTPLRIRWPAGTKVRDMATNKLLVASPSGKLVPHVRK